MYSLAGPIKGAALKAAMGTPRSSLRQRSASVPPTRVIGAEKAMPSMARQTRRVSMFWATAQGMMKITATRRVEPLFLGCHHMLAERSRVSFEKSYISQKHLLDDPSAVNF